MLNFPMINAQFIIQIIISVLSFVPALVFHEVAHGYTAYKLGDPTAKNAGRLSLNPIKHIDIFGTVILPAILMLMNWPVIGYAKPVPYNPSYFKEPKKGDLIVGLAGPLANLILACIASVIAWILITLIPTSVSNTYVFSYVFVFLYSFASINLFLMMFNLLPIPPLDGSSIFAVIIPEKYLGKYYQIQRYAMPVFMILLIVVPFIFNFNPISLYMDATAGNLIRLIFPIKFM